MKVIAIFAGLILLLVGIYLAVPNPGKKALQKEKASLEDVTSWRIITEISRNGRPMMGRTYAALCPDKEHVLERNEGDFAEYIRIGDDEYYRKNRYQWVKGSPGPDLLLPIPTPRPCLSNPGEPSSRPPGGAEEMRLAIESEIKDGNIQKGRKGDFKGTPCQEWTITRFSGSKLGSYITCLTEPDNLPLYTRNASEDFHMYYEWNPTVIVEAPDLSPPGKMPTGLP